MAKRAPVPPSVPACYAMVFPGLEGVAEDEITHDLGGDVRRTTRGVVVFRVPEVDRRVLRLRTVEDVFLFAWGTDKLTYRAKDLESIRKWTAREVPWDQLLKLHHAIRPKPKGRPTFRLVTQMTGEHGYRRTDARKALAEGLAGKLPASWRPAEENAAVEIWLTIHGQTAVCGLRLSDRELRHRTYKMEHQPASLRPTIAAAMVRLAELKPGQAILDPMCGAGTILAEALTFARMHRLDLGSVWGGDIEASAVRAAGTNLRKLGDVRLARWDAAALPLPDGSIDRVVCNPPFGKQLGDPEQIGPLYEALLAECARVVRPRGKAVLLVGDPDVLRPAAARAGWTPGKHLRVRVLGQWASMSVWKKVE